ncbi:MAG: DinB family protein [Bacteroidota bacterium]
MIDIQEVPEFYRGYVLALGAGELVPLLLKTGDDFISFGRGLNENQGNYRYAEEKWSVKEVMQHVIDSERIFAYRALRFARNDATELSGFEQNDYVPESNSNNRTIISLMTEFTNVRASSVDLFTSFKDDIRQRSGLASGVNISVEAIGYIISGHVKHHLNVLQERYTK